MQVDRKNRAAVTRAVGEEDTSPVSEIFFGQLRSTVVNYSTRQPSHTLEPFCSLHLDITHHTESVEEAIWSLTHEEDVESSNGTTRFKKQTLLEKLPPVLVLHLKRFVYDAYDGTQKLRKQISYSSHLTIIPGILYQLTFRNAVISY